MRIDLSPDQEEAIKVLSPQKFHRLFTLPATEIHGLLKVTYAIAGPEEGDVPTILFCGGMVCPRWHMFSYEHLAQKNGVRVISIDRPGFGGSTPVPVTSRMSTFLEIIPALLSSLKIKTVSIVSHSAGTTYALNLLAHYPSLLSPTHPSITLFSPWVHQSITSVSFLVAASHLPNPLLNLWDNTIGFIINSATPTFASSSGIFSTSSDIFKTKSASETKQKDGEEEENKCRESYGISLAVKKELDKLIWKYVFEENTKGINDEARFCLKSVEGCSWDRCESYPTFAQNLKEEWEKNESEGKAKLSMKIVFAGTDRMIGEKGIVYFKECFSGEKCGKGIGVDAVRIEGTDHDSVISPEEEVMRLVFEQLR